MPLEFITQVTGRGVCVPGDDIDTDRIIPARFMKCITFDGLGEYLFYDVRKNDDGSDKKHPLNDPRFSDASILISGSNFGCGSSREHAPQAIYRAGFRAVLAVSFAEIFFGNSITLGMPCMSLRREDLREIAEKIEAEPSAEITLDIAKKSVRLLDKEYPAEIREAAREVLMNGHWDPIADLLEGKEETARVAERLSYV